jgi:hypothetical protein
LFSSEKGGKGKSEKSGKDAKIRKGYNGKQKGVKNEHKKHFLLKFVRPFPFVTAKQIQVLFYGTSYLGVTTYVILLQRTIFDLKMTAFWDRGPCSVVEVDRRFRDAYCLYHQGDEGDNMNKRRPTSTKLHGAIAQKAVTFILVTVRT